MMDGAFELSLAAVDILSEALGLDCRVFPLRVPSVGAVLEDRVRIARAVFGDLAKRGLVYHDRLSLDIVGALRLLATNQVSISIAGLRDDDPPLYARAASSGREAVLVLQLPNGLRFEGIRPTGLVRAAVGLLPRAKAGAGQSITIADEPKSAAPLWPEDEPDSFVQPARPSRSGSESLRAAAAAILQRPREGTGNFTVHGRDRHGHEITIGDVSWFDTDAGRYLSRRTTDADGRHFYTWSPADRSRLEQVLGDLVDDAVPKPR